MDPLSALRQDLISACRILSRQKLVEGFGHVSARLAGADSFLITPRIALAIVEEADLLTLDLRGNILDGRQQPPFEAWLHTAIMKSHPEVNAIARVHARIANIFSVTDRKLEPVHNHGSFFAGGVPVFSKPELISTEALGNEVARSLGARPAILLRGNGQVTVGRTIPEAVMMAIYLEEAAVMLHGALQIGTPIPLTAEESRARQTEALPPVDLERAWNFFKHSVQS